jgi:feruloyl esterase
MVLKSEDATWENEIRENDTMRPLNTFLSAACAFVLASPGLTIAQQTCESLKDLKLDHATVVSAAAQEPAPLKAPPGTPFKVPDFTIPRHCEVTAIARPTVDSEIDFTLWLPPKDVWNGKYMQRGNGGWAGSIQPAVLVAPLARGYAVSATDDGHRTQGIMPDASWAIGHPEKLIDFGYRSLHETATLSKAILEAYYGKPSDHAYFSGCSDGGREALMEAERFPEDFDGIIAGAPANHWTHHFTGFVWNEIALNGKPESKITPEQLPAIQKAALASCDALDGVKDGLIQDPRRCHFDPAVLLCHGAPSADCLTQPQIETLQKIYAGPKNPKTGEQIYPGYEPGTEAEAGGWSIWIVGISAHSLFGNSFYSGAVHEDPHWDWHTMDFDRDLRLADEKTGSILNSDNPDLRSFRDRGGKLIQYHGWGDAAIAPRDSIAFYEKVRTFMERYPDPRSATPKDIQAFYRLFMVPAMQHCTGGPGAVSFGNDELASLNAKPDDADNDILLALDRWVTQGVAPDKLIASGKIGADPKTKTDGIPLTRPLCAYPGVAQYKGQGDTNAAENFACVKEPTK